MYIYILYIYTLYIYVHLMIVWWYSLVLWWKHLLYLGIRWSDTLQNMTCSKTCSNTNWWFQTPLKNMSSSVGSILPNMWKVIKFHGSKSPTRICSMVTQGFQPHSTPASPQSGETRQSLRADSCRTEGNRRAESQFTNHTGITRYNGITFPANLEMWLFPRWLCLS